MTRLLARQSAAYISWDQLLARPDIIGARFEQAQMNAVYRGTITSVAHEGDDFVIAVAHIEVQKENDGPWQPSDHLGYFFAKMRADALVHADGSIHMVAKYTYAIISIWPRV